MNLGLEGQGDSKVAPKVLWVRGSTEEWVEQGKIPLDETNSRICGGLLPK